MREATVKQLANALLARGSQTWLVRVKFTKDEALRTSSQNLTHRQAQAYARALREKGYWAEVARMN